MLKEMTVINKNSPLPLYYQLKEEVISLIDRGSLKPGDKIPSERELCEYHAVSRMTVHKAVDQLVQEGYLYREHGKGTFVAHKRETAVISPLTSFTRVMKERGLQASTEQLNWEKTAANRELAEKLEVNEGDQLYLLERLRKISGEPFLWEKVYLPVKLIPALTPEELVDNSLYQMLQDKYHYQLNYAEATIEPVLLAGRIAQLLQAGENTMGLRFYQLTYLEQGQPIEWTEAYYRSDNYKFRFKFGEKI